MTSGRRQKAAEPDRTMAWMTTYSDMVTLLLAFFVLLFSFSSIDVIEFERVIMSLQQALGMLQGGRTITSVEPMMDVGDARHQQQIEAIQRSQLLAARMQLQGQLSEAGLEEGVTFDLTERGLIIHFTDRVLFESGEAELLPGARDILDLLAPTLENLPNQVRVEGHTDDVPINTFRFPSNWELSTARATNVLRYLLGTAGMSPDNLSAAGYGEHRPRDTNRTDAGRVRNRRVDVVLLRLEAHGTEPVAVSDDLDPDPGGGEL